MIPVTPGLPTFGYTPAQTAFGTAITVLIPGVPTDRGLPLLYSVVAGPQGNRPNWTDFGWFAHLTDLIVTCGSTQNIQYIMRPLNWTTCPNGAAKNQNVINVADDPGLFSTNYRYPIPGQTWNPPGTKNANGPALADDAAAANDYVAYQTQDGVWHLDTISSVSTLAWTMTTTLGNFTNGAIAAGSPIFWFGLFSETVPYTGLAHIGVTPEASNYAVNVLAAWGGNASAVGGGGGASSGNGVPAINPGDPLLVYNPNATATTFNRFIGGYWAKF